MPRTVCKLVYKYNELPEDIQEKACQNYRAMGMEYHWIDEGIESIKAFCREYNVTLLKWEVGLCRPYDWKSDVSNKNFRGVKLKSVDKDAMPTGYCLDADIRYKFHDEFTQTGDALYAFTEAVDAGFRGIVAEMEYQETDAYIGELMEINEYEFDEFGNIQ